MAPNKIRNVRQETVGQFCKVPEKKIRKTKSDPKPFLEEKELRDLLDQSMRCKLIDIVTPIAKGNKKKRKNTLKNLKLDYIAKRKNPPKSVADNVDDMKNDKAEITRRSMGKYRITVKDIWLKFIELNFDTIRDEVIKKVDSCEESTSGESSTDQTKKGSSSEDKNDSENNPSAATPAIDEAIPGSFIRSCNTLTRSILRNDLPEDIKEIFYQKVNNTLVECTNFISDYSNAAEYSIVALFNLFDNTNKYDDKKCISSIVPTEFLKDNYKDQKFINTPFKAASLNNDTWNKNYSILFNSHHLQNIFTSNFGLRGVTDASKSKISTLDGAPRYDGEEPCRNRFRKLLNITIANYSKWSAGMMWK